MAHTVRVGTGVGGGGAAMVTVGMGEAPSIWAPLPSAVWYMVNVLTPGVAGVV